MATPKTTSDIQMGSWVTIQMSLAGANDFSDTTPLDDNGGKTLVLDKGVWKYPQQNNGGRFVVPGDTGRPIRLVNVMANFGASVPFEIHVADVPNTSGEPYDPADAALYSTGDFIVHSGTTQYLADNLDAADAGIAVVVWPGQKIYFVTTGALNPIVRFTLSQGLERD